MVDLRSKVRALGNPLQLDKISGVDPMRDARYHDPDTGTGILDEERIFVDVSYDGSEVNGITPISFLR